MMVLTSSSMADGQTYEVNSGWNLLGATEDISDLTPFAKKGSMIWVYDDGEWKAIIPQKGGQIEQTQGFCSSPIRKRISWWKRRVNAPTI